MEAKWALRSQHLSDCHSAVAVDLPLHHCNEIQHNTIKLNYIQFNTIQFNAMQYNMMQYGKSNERVRVNICQKKENCKNMDKKKDIVRLIRENIKQ